MDRYYIERKLQGKTITEWYPADEVAELAKQGIKYRYGHTDDCCLIREYAGTCDCEYYDYYTELEQIVKEGE